MASFAASWTARFTGMAHYKTISKGVVNYDSNQLRGSAKKVL